MAGWRANKLNCWGFWGLLAHSSRGFFLQALDFHFLLKFGLWPSSLLIACLVPLIAACEVNPSTAYRGLGGSVIRVQVGLAYILKWCLWASHLRLSAELKPCYFLAGIIWGLWIAGFAKYSPDLWGQPCQVSASCAWQGVGFLLLRAICNGNGNDGNVGHGSFADQLLGNSVGAIESVVRAIIAFSFGRAATWVASASPCLVQLAPFGGFASGFRLFGLG
jgi:hypothetical protein